MSLNRRRYVIYGAGAVGGVIGAGLALGGQDVALIARGAHLKVLQQDGLRFFHHDGDDVVKLPAVEHPGELNLTSDDVVIMAMKTQHTEAALEVLASASPPGIAVVCAQNGVENERLALRRFANVYGMCVLLPASHLEPGKVVAIGAPMFGVLDVGRYPTGADTLAAEIATALTSSNFRSEASPAIMRHKYAKLRMNAGNALDAATGPESRGSELRARAGAEALAVFAAAGIDVATKDEANDRRAGFTVAEVEGQPRSGSSSWQSLARGAGSIESDFLNGEIVMLGRAHDVPTPVNEVLQRLANSMAAAGDRPGSLSLADVEALIDQ